MTSRSDLIEAILIVCRRAGASDQTHYEMELGRVLNEHIGPEDARDTDPPPDVPGARGEETITPINDTE